MTVKSKSVEYIKERFESNDLEDLPCLNYDVESEDGERLFKERIERELEREEKNGKENSGVSFEKKCTPKQEEKEVKEGERENKGGEEAELVKFTLNNSARISLDDRLLNFLTKEIKKYNNNIDSKRVLNDLLNKLKTTTNVIREIEVICEGKNKIKQALIFFLLHIYPIIYNSAFGKIFPPNVNPGSIKFILEDLERKGLLKRVNDSEFIHEKQVFMSANSNPHAGRFPIRWYTLTEMAANVFRAAPFSDEKELENLFSSYKMALRRTHKVLKQRQKRIEANKKEEEEQRRRREEQRKVRIEYLEQRFNVAKDFLQRFSLAYFDTKSTRWKEIQTTLVNQFGIDNPNPHEVKEITRNWRKGGIENARCNSR